MKEYSGPCPPSQIALDNVPVEYKVWEARDGWTPGPGWEFVDSRYQAGYTTYSQQSYYENGVTKYTSALPCEAPGRTWLVFRRRREAVIEELQLQVSALQAKELEGRQKIFDVEKAFKEMACRLEAAETMVTNRNSQLSQKQVEIQAERDRCKKMEVDIQKLRAALGEIRMQEILGGE